MKGTLEGEFYVLWSILGCKMWLGDSVHYHFLSFLYTIYQLTCTILKEVKGVDGDEQN
mgnify:CR=1 FL=1